MAETVHAYILSLDSDFGKSKNLTEYRECREQ